MAGDFQGGIAGSLAGVDAGFGSGVRVDAGFNAEVVVIGADIVD